MRIGILLCDAFSPIGARTHSHALVRMQMDVPSVFTSNFGDLTMLTCNEIVKG